MKLNYIEFPDEEIKKIEHQFVTNRVAMPHLCIITSCDSGHYSLFSKKAPSPEIIARVTVLSNYALRIIEQNIFSTRKMDPKVRTCRHDFR